MSNKIYSPWHTAPAGTLLSLRRIVDGSESDPVITGIMTADRLDGKPWLAEIGGELLSAELGRGKGIDVGDKWALDWGDEVQPSDPTRLEIGRAYALHPDGTLVMLCERQDGQRCYIGLEGDARGRVVISGGVRAHFGEVGLRAHSSPG
jgi:hypothetical protein